MTSRVVIAIDGPAASGKSSTAQWVARRLGYFHVDSGSLYRAATAVQLSRQSSPDQWTEAEVLEAAQRVSFQPASDRATFVPLIDGKDCEEELRGPGVTQNVSRVAAMPRVREWVNGLVRSSSIDYDVVVDGRDIGAAVFPDAPLKLFLVADPWERARRRLIQRLGCRPNDPEIAQETEQIVKRDAKDAMQTVQAGDAILIDTTYLTQADQVERIVALANAVTHRPSDTSAIDG